MRPHFSMNTRARDETRAARGCAGRQIPV